MIYDPDKNNRHEYFMLISKTEIHLIVCQNVIKVQDRINMHAVRDPFLSNEKCHTEFLIRFFNESKIKWHSLHTGNAFMFIVVVFEVWAILQFNLILSLTLRTNRLVMKWKVLEPVFHLL